MDHKKQVVLLYFTTLLGTLIGVVSSILNTRFLNPTDYGDVRYVQNIVALVSCTLLFGYFWSGSRLLALSKDEAYSRRVRGAMVAILAISSACLITAMLCCTWFYRESETLFTLFLIAAPLSVNTILLNYLNTTAQGDNHIGRLSLSRVLPQLLYVLIAFFIYRQFGATSSRMIMLQMGTSFVVLAILVSTTRPSFSNLKPIFEELNTENKNYGIQLYIGSLAMVATNYLAGVTLGVFNEDNVNVGFYTLALTVAIPLQQLPSIIGTTYFKQFATQDRIPVNVMKNSILITVASCICFVVLIRPFVSVIYSEEYAIVGTYASFLAVGFSIHGLGDMLNRYLGSHGQGKPIRNSSFVCGVFKVFGYVVLVYLWDITGALITTICSSLAYSAMIAYYYIKYINYANNK